jgi:hypothetical protein
MKIFYHNLVFKIVYKAPLIYPLLKWRFPEIDFNRDTVITIGDTIYTKRTLHPKILQHELIHVRQQKGSKLYAYFYFIPRYFFDKKFRDRVEGEGHAAEA